MYCCYIVSEPADKNHRANDATAQLGDCWNGRYHFCEFQPVQDRGLARCVQAKHQDAHILGAQHPLPHLAEEHAHDAEVPTGTCYLARGSARDAAAKHPRNNLGSRHAPCHVMPHKCREACHPRTILFASQRTNVGLSPPPAPHVLPGVQPQFRVTKLHPSMFRSSSSPPGTRTLGTWRRSCRYAWSDAKCQPALFSLVLGREGLLTLNHPLSWELCSLRKEADTQKCSNLSWFIQTGVFARIPLHGK